MPIYEFRCEACDKLFEHLAMSKGDVVEVKCPHCGSSELSRVMSTCASVVSGSPSAPAAGQSGPTMENRSCPNTGNCGTLTLPGVD